MFGMAVLRQRTICVHTESKKCGKEVVAHCVTAFT